MNEYYPDNVSHPGETLEEYLEENNIYINDFYKISGLLPSEIINIVKGEKEINDSIATELEKATNINKRFWLNRQKNYNNGK